MSTTYPYLLRLLLHHRFRQLDKKVVEGVSKGHGDLDALHCHNLQYCKNFCLHHRCATNRCARCIACFHFEDQRIFPNSRMAFHLCPYFEQASIFCLRLHFYRGHFLSPRSRHKLFVVLKLQ